MVVEPDVPQPISPTRWSRRAHEPQNGGPMVADSDHPSIPAHRLAKRLRDLREQQHLTQKQLAKVLGGSGALSIATVSLWEKPGSDRLPPPQRLAAYARLFCTSRAFASGAPRLLHDDELTEQEREREAGLYAELLYLRERTQSTDAAIQTHEQSALEQPALGQRALGQRDSIWRFADEKPISIVCSGPNEGDRPSAYADPGHLNFSRYARHADLDALIEVFGQVKADNPTSMIRILLPEELKRDFALCHLIFIGGAAVRNARNKSHFDQDIPLPEAEPIPDTKTHLFRCRVGEESREFRSLFHGDGTLAQDVGLIARSPHPNIPDRTVTVLSGITSRGVHGAALCFADSHIRDTNEQYLKDTFGNTETFCILMKVAIGNDAALPPNLSRDDVRLYEWSAETGARW